MEILNIKRLATCTISCSCYISNRMVKLKRKQQKVIVKSKPVVHTGTKLKDLEKWSSQLNVQILYSKIRANRKELSKLHGKSFDNWFKKVEKLPIIEEHRKDYIKYLKNIKNTTKLFKDLQKEIISEPEFSEDNPPKNYDNSPSALAFRLNKISADALGITVDKYLEDRS